MIRDFKDFIKYIKYEVLDADFNDLHISFYDDSITFELCDLGILAIEYCGDPDDIHVIILDNTQELNISFEEIKDIYGVMKAIKDNHDLLDGFLKK